MSWPKRLRNGNVRHIKEAQILQTTGLQGLQAVDPADLGPEQAIRSIVEGIRMERLVAGDATQRTEVGPPGERPPFVGLSDEELETVIWTTLDRSLDGENEDEHESEGQ